MGEHRVRAGYQYPAIVTGNALLDAIHRAAARTGRTFGEMCMTLRVALTGTTVSEPIQDLLATMGRETVLAKLDGWREP